MSGVWTYAPRKLASAGALVTGLALAVAVTAGAQEEARLADELVAFTNLDRTSNGLPALSIDRRLLPLAAERSQDMLARDYFSHAIPPDGRQVFDSMRQRGIRFRTAGENLEQNTAPRSRSVRYAQGDFMNSPSHRALILSPDMDHVAAGVALGEDRTVFTVLFVGLDETGPESQVAPMLGGADAPAPPTDAATRRPSAGSGGDAAMETPLPPQPAAEVPLGRLRQTSARPLGLIEELVNRTLRLYLGF